MNWIAVAGPIGAGKDTVGEWLVENRGFTLLKFADPLREMALAVDPYVDVTGEGHFARLSELVADEGWEQAKRGSSDVRGFLQRLGTNGVRDTLGEDVWVNIAERRAGDIDGPVVFTDCRFPNEAEMVRDWGGQTWWIDRPGCGESGHSSEGALTDWMFTRTVLNTGSLEGLRNQLSSMI